MTEYTEHKTEFALPSSFGEPLTLGFFYGIALLGCFSAVWNLNHPQFATTPERCASLVWLLGCGLVFGLNLYWVGIKKSTLSLLRCCSQDRYLLVLNDDAQGQRLWSGFRILGLTFRVFEVPISGIRCLEWSLGQASSRMGEDMDDWLVFFLLKSDSVLYELGQASENETSYYFTGLGGAKEKTDAQVESLLAFLSSHDVRFVSGEKSNVFVLPEAGLSTTKIGMATSKSIEDRAKAAE